MVYNLGNFRYKNGKIYKKVWWIFFRCVDTNHCSYLNGVRKVNRLCGIWE